eukprot:TRINITY_DN7745_c0_g5_i1.p1 TRINITY_DN7745_c0_g5~~TRINITY_DN7745_c0_g5_i1.p1  ORF type:complete len:329 (+),score=37.75 TRINITY_DN7745_c0_g5_i1:216-1202(+)
MRGNTATAGKTSSYAKEVKRVISAAAPKTDELPLPVNLLRFTTEVAQFSRSTPAGIRGAARLESSPMFSTIELSWPQDPAERSSGYSAHPSWSSGAQESLTDAALFAYQEEDMQGSPDPRTSMRMTAEVGLGLSGSATIMLKNISKAASPEDVAMFLQSACPGQVDYLYLPVVSRTFQHRCYAFVNFVSAIAADRFYERFHNVAVQDITSIDKVFSVAPADRQGFVENVSAYMTSHLQGNQGVHAHPLLWGRRQCRYMLQHWGQEIHSLSPGPCGSVQLVPKADLPMASSGQVNPRSSAAAPPAAAGGSEGLISRRTYFSPTFEYLSF